MTLRAEKLEETRQRIVEATLALHEELGPARTTVAAIAKRASVSRPTVYNQFPDDLSLFSACSGHFLAQHPAPGNGIHYAGTLPMRAEPARHELHPDGRLQGTARVFVTDGSAFPRLPAKNLTYTIMANALRIAAGVRKGLG